MLRRKIVIAALILVIIVLVIPALPITAEINPGISIEGELRQLKPGALLCQGSTMVPIRLVAEDPALMGKVYWDGAFSKVAIDCKGKYLEFFLGSKQAQVDGITKQFDVAPFIYENRTYVPLRFLAEALGATVSWNSAQQLADISFGYRPEVFAYYYYSPWEEFAANAGLFSDVVLRWFKTDRKGSLSYEYEDQYQKIMQYIKQQNIRAHLGVALMDADALHSLLNTFNYRRDLIQQLKWQVEKNQYDGVNIDFEFIPAADADAFTQFLTELRTALGPDKMLSVAVFARTGKENWPTAYQYGNIGKIADRVVVMAYDFSYVDSSPGPVAPLWWVRDVNTYMLAQIPREKILLGMPTYGYNWMSAGQAAAVTKPKLTLIQNQYQIKAGFDEASMSPYYIYYDENGQQHTIWLENETSLNEKYRLAVSSKLAGISFWRIGNGFDDLYEVLRRHH